MTSSRRRRGEVDVDVGIGRPALVDEALEEQLVADGVDARDAQHVGHDRVARAAPTLGRDAPLAAEAHQVPADEEELGQAGPLDDLQLVRQLLEHARRERVVARAGALVAEPLQLAEGRLAAGHREAGEAVALELQLDRAAGCRAPGRAQPLRPGARHARSRRHGRSPAQAGRQRAQLRRPLEVVLPVGPAQVGALVERQAVADADQHVLELAILGPGVVDVVGDDDRQPEPLGQARRLGHQPVVVGQEVVLQLDEEAGSQAAHRAIALGQATRHRFGPGTIAGQQPPRDLTVAASARAPPGPRRARPGARA